jgi:predicted Ser/Thr protein kinase
MYNHQIIYIYKGIDGNKRFIVKYLTVDNDKKNIKNEIINQNIAAKIGIAPKILTYTDDYILMDFIDGITVEQYLQKYENSDKLIRKILEALSKLHEKNIIHRDVHLGNFIIDKKIKYG